MLARTHEQGFTYVGVLILVAIAGVALAGAGELWSTASKREKETQLLFVGDEFRRAIGSYYEGSPGAKQFPLRLEDLLEDKRLPVVRRHLRKVYIDPMTGTSEWGLVKLGDRITGVHSQIGEKPLKRTHFNDADAAFEGSKTYADWRFIYKPSAESPIPPTPGPGASPTAASLPRTKSP